MRARSGWRPPAEGPRDADRTIDRSRRLADRNFFHRQDRASAIEAIRLALDGARRFGEPGDVTLVEAEAAKIASRPGR